MKLNWSGGSLMVEVQCMDNNLLLLGGTTQK